MARKSFTFKRSTAGSPGAYLQADPAVLGSDDDSALRSDDYVVVPTNPVAGGAEVLFEANATDYHTIELTWEITSELAVTLTDSPQATRLLIVYSFNGFPQTLRDGSVIATSTSTSGSFTHQGVSSGRWAYYSLFVEYQSTSIRTWYELIGSIETLVPVNYGSTDDLWQRIPTHYRLQDQQLANDTTNPNSHGPLYRALSVFGWDIDRFRTLVDFQMTARDPEFAEVEVLNALAYELGCPISTEDLGPSRLRNFLRDVRINNTIKGTIEGVRQALTSITGAPVEIKSPRPEYLSATQRSFSGGVVASVPTTDQWGYTTAASVTCSASAGGCVAARTAGGGYEFTVLSTQLSIYQSARYRTYYDVLDSTGASVAGAYLSIDRQPYSSWVLIPGSGYVDEGPPGWDGKRSNGVDWFKTPHDHGIVGDGTFAAITAWLHLVVVFPPGASSVVIKNPSVVSLDTYPYTVDIYSERVNLVRDPQFAYTPNIGVTSASTGFWNVYTDTGSLTLSPVNPASTGGAAPSILSEAVLWIDAGSDGGVSSVVASSGTMTVMPSHSVVPVTVNNNVTARLTPIRLGVEYNFSVIDRSTSIQSVALKSRTYGLLAEATTPYRETTTLDGVRRYWLLYRPYEEPWLPEDIEDCYLEISARAESGTGFTFREPLLEALLRNGEYFDGETANGGWLRGSNFNGTADYRWGTAGENQSFSYYATDYARMVSTVNRVLDYLLPVTETNATIRFNRVFGYSGTDMP